MPRCREAEPPPHDPLPAGEGKDGANRSPGAGKPAYIGGMHQASARLEFHTQGTGLTEITGDVASWVGTTGIATGLLTLHCLHTSASLLITENASGAVQRDVVRWLEKLAREDADYEHDDEGPDDMPAHLKAVLTGVTLSLPVGGGKPVLGTWQGIFLAEHRRAPYRRAIALHVIGE